jgi:hypothetical protein
MKNAVRFVVFYKEKWVRGSEIIHPEYARILFHEELER